jgi:hypothetical protein
MRRKMVGHAKKPLLLSLLAVTLLALGGCGDSKEEKALTAVCEAKNDIGKQVDTLQSLTLQTVTVDKVQSGVTAIRDDLKTISDNLPTVADDVKPDIQQANDQFKTQLGLIAVNIGRSISAEDSKAMLQASLTQLSESYQQAFAKVQCPDSQG